MVAFQNFKHILCGSARSHSKDPHDDSFQKQSTSAFT